MAKDFNNRKNSGAFAELAPEVLATVPPQAVELEEAVLGALMLEADKITEVQEYLTESSFYKEEHRLIYRVMNESRTLGLSVQQTHDYVVTEINGIDGLEVQYFSIVNGDTLADVASWDDAPSIVGCITVFCGTKPIRLIDHIRYK